MKTVRRLVSVLLVLCLLAGNIGITAFADSVLTLPTSTRIIDEEAFYNAQSIRKVILSEGIQEIRARAFASSTLSEINLPDSLTFIAKDALDGPDKVHVTAHPGTYAYDWAVTEGYIIPVSSITLNKLKLALKPGENEQLTVSVEPSNASSTDVTWSSDNPDVADVDQEGIVTAIAEGTANIIASAKVGENVTGVCTVTVASDLLSIELETAYEYYLQYDRVTVVAETEYAVGKVTYNYQVLDHDNTVLRTEVTDRSVFEFIANSTGDLSVICTAVDQAGASVTDSISTSIYTYDQVRPITPSKIYLNGIELAADPIAADIYPQKGFSFTWAAAANSDINSPDSYYIGIRLDTANGYSMIANSDELRIPVFDLPDDIFDDLSQTTLVQVQLIAKNRAVGDTTIGFFKVKSLEEQRSITVNGKRTYDLNIVSYAQCKQQVTIASIEEWSVECDADWIDCFVVNDNLEICLDQNPLDRTRSAYVYVNNGFNTAAIHITQGCVRTAPTIKYPSIIEGMNAANAASCGDLYLEFEKNKCDVIVARVLKKNDNGEYSLFSYQNTAGSDMIIVLPDSLVGADCLLEISGYTNEAFAEWNENTVGTFVRYYSFTCTGDHFVSVNGQGNLSLTITTTEEIIIHTSTVWTYTSDADWLDLSVSNASVNRPDCKGIITTVPNLTEDVRIGHIHIVSGTAEAVITIKQPSLIPHATTAKGLSTDINDPTELYHWETQFFCYSLDHMKIIELERTGFGENVSYSEIGTLFEQSFENIQEDFFLTLSDIQVSTNARLIKVIVSNPYISQEYYFSAYENSYTQGNDIQITLTDDQVLESSILQWKVNAEHTEKTVLLKASKAVTSYAGWTILSNTDWISLSEPTNSASTQREKEIVISIDQNNTGVTRTAVITFKSRGYNTAAMLVIEQSAMDYISVMDNETLVQYEDDELLSISSGSESTIGLRIQTGGNWSVQSSDEWISVNFIGQALYQSDSTYEEIVLLLTNNPYGNEARVGTVWFTSGSAEFSLIIEQVAQLPPLAKPVIISDIGSTSYENPSIFVQQNLDVSWLRIENAVGYQITLSNGIDEYEYYIQADGNEEYAYTIPVAWIPVTEQIASLKLSAFDAQGTAYVSDIYYFIATASEKVVIEGSTSPEWLNIDDRGETKEFIIMSPDSWAATVEESWIHISNNNGTNGETITVIVDANESIERQGSIVFSVNDNITILSIHQLAALSVSPQVIISDYSSNPEMPTVITNSTDSINILWNYEKQANAYCIYLKTLNEQGSWASVAESGMITDGIGSYTFTDLSLDQYVIYCISLVRIVYGRMNYSVDRYFVIEEETPTIEIRKGDRTLYQATDELHIWGTDDWLWFQVAGSGTVIVTANDDWSMVYSDKLTEEKLAMYNQTADDYRFMLVPPPEKMSYYTGYRTVCVSGLPNYTGHARQGSITMRCGTYSITIPFTQEAEIIPAQLYSPQLSQDKNNPTILPCERINMRWQAGQFGTGEYNAVLYEKAPGDTDFEHVKSTHISSNLYCSISTQYLHEGSDYRVRLYTYGNDGEEVYESYYFRISNNAGGDDDPGDTIDEGTTKVTGIVTTESGEKLPDVYVLAVNTTDENDTSNTQTDADGTWSMYLTIGKTYAFEYYSIDYLVPGITRTIIPGLTLNALANLPGVLDQEISFTMRRNGELVNSIRVGESVDFDVTVPDGVQYVRLVADDIPYDIYPVENGHATFSRVFSSVGNGRRKIQFQSYVNNDWGAISSAQYLNVTNSGTLQAVNIHPIDTYALDSGENFVVSWDGVPNAISYTVYLYLNGIQHFPLAGGKDDATTEGTTLSLPLSKVPLSAANGWVAQVVATGAPGYDSSTSSIQFNVVETLGDAVFLNLPAGMTTILGDKITGSVYGNKNAGTLTVYMNHQPGDAPADRTPVELTDHSFEVPADLPGSYMFTLYNGCGELCDTATIEVREPMVQIDSKGRPMFDVNGYRVFEYETVNTPLEFHVTYNFIPTSVRLYQDETIIESVNNPDGSVYFTFSKTLAGENTFHYYKIEALFNDLDPVITNRIPIYCVQRQSETNKRWYADKDTTLYQYPDGTLVLNPIGANELVQLGNYTYDGYWEVKYHGQTGFVSSNDLQPCGQIDEDQLVITSELDNSNEKIVWLNSENDSRSIEFTIMAGSNIDHLKAVVSRVSAEHYVEHYMDASVVWETAEPVTIRHENGSVVFAYTVTFDRLACYRVEFVGFDTNGQQRTTQVLAYGQYIPTLKLASSYNSKRYAKCEAFKNHDLTVSPVDKLANCSVGINDELLIEGNAGGGYYYVTGTKGSGFIHEYDLLTAPNDTVRRGFIFASEHIYENDILTFYKKLNVYLPMMNSVRMMTSAFGDNGIYPLYVEYSASSNTLDGYFSIIKEVADFNDVTYLYILTHGNKSGMRFDADNDTPIYGWNKLANQIADINGKVVLILGPCHSGAFKSYLGGFDKERYSIIMSASADESNWSYKLSELYSTTSEEYYPIMELALYRGIQNRNDLTLLDVFERANNQYQSFRNYLEHTTYPYWVENEKPFEYMEGQWWPFERYDQRTRQHIQKFGNPDNIIFP